MKDNNDIQNALNVFDKFVNAAVSAKIEGFDVIEIVVSYNTIRNFINQHIEMDKEDIKE